MNRNTPRKGPGKRDQRYDAGCNVCEHRAGLEMLSWKPTRHNNGEGRRQHGTERNVRAGSTGVVVTARSASDGDATREVCEDGSRLAADAQRSAREGKVRFLQMADGPVVPMKFGNANRGTGPWSEESDTKRLQP
jgi:hypothetical protein